MGRVATSLKLLLRPRWAGQTDLVEDYEAAFARLVIKDPTMPALAVWRGRVALWAILRAAGVAEGAEVILPSYICEMVPAAVKFAGGKCVYVDAAPGQFNCSTRSMADAVTERTRAIICLHTYGIPMPVGDLVPLAAEPKITLIEDCCQVISRQSRWGTVAAVGGAAFFSTQWSKPYSTGLGGMAVFSDHGLYRRVKEIRQKFPTEDDRRRSRSLAMQMLLYDLTVRPLTKAMIATAYRWAQRAGLVRGTTTVEEYGTEMPVDYPARATNVQAALGLQALQEWDENVRHRRRLTAFYLERLGDLGVDVSPMLTGSKEPVLWAAPVMVENMPEMLARAGRKGLPLSTWFGVLPVHATPERAAAYDYAMGLCPRTEWMLPREVNLLTGPSVTLTQAEAALTLLKRHGKLAPLR